VTRVFQALAFASIATLAYAGLTWRHQPILMSRDAPRPLVIEWWMIGCLAAGAFATFFAAWLAFLRFSKSRRPWLAGLTAGIAAGLVPIAHLWLYRLAEHLLVVRSAASEPVSPAFAVTFAVLEFILATGLWYAVSLLAIAWFTIPLSAGMGMLFLLAQERRALSGTRARSAPPAPR